MRRNKSYIASRTDHLKYNYVGCRNGIHLGELVIDDSRIVLFNINQTTINNAKRYAMATRKFWNFKGKLRSNRKILNHTLCLKKY